MIRSVALPLSLAAALAALGSWILGGTTPPPTSTATRAAPSAAAPPADARSGAPIAREPAPSDSGARRTLRAGTIDPDDPRAIFVTGRLLREDGSPVAQESFSLHFDREGLASGITDPRGGFHTAVRGIEAGAALHHCSAFLHTRAGRSVPDAAPLDVATLQRGENDLGELIVAELPVLAAGRVRGATRRSGVGLHLTVEARSEPAAPWTTLRTFADWPEADDAAVAILGRPFVIRGRGIAGEHRLAIRPADFDLFGPGAQDRFAAVPFRPGEQDLVVDLPARGTLQVLVIQPCATPSLRLMLWPDSQPDAPILPTTVGTGGDGYSAIYGATPSREPAIPAHWDRLVAGTYRLEIRAQGWLDPLLSETIEFAANEDGEPSLPVVVRLGQAFSEVCIRVDGAGPRLVLLTPSDPPVARILNTPSDTVSGPTPMTFDLVSPGHPTVRLRGIAGDCAIQLPSPRNVSLALPTLGPANGWPEGWRGELVVEAVDADGHYAKTVLLHGESRRLGDLLGTTRRMALGIARIETMPAPPGGRLQLSARIWGRGRGPTAVRLSGPAQFAVDSIQGPIPVTLDRADLAAVLGQ